MRNKKTIWLIIAVAVVAIVGIVALILIDAGRTETEEENTYIVTFDGNGTNVDNLPKPQEIKDGEYVTEPEEPTRENYFFIGWHTSPDAVALVDTSIDFEKYTVKQDTTLYAIWESMTIDIDGDGLNYKEETQYGTDAFAIDTDFDGLSDGEEVNTYKTNPLNADSDNDGIKEGAEIALGLNPLSAMSDGVTQDANRRIEFRIQDDNQFFNLSICAKPNMLSSVSTETFSLNLLESSDGLISPIIDIEYDKTTSFEYATLTFDYSNVDLMGINEKDLTFLYLNEETGLYEIVPSSVNTTSKTVAFTPTHFSSYVVGDRSVASHSFSYSENQTINYGGDTIKVNEVVATDFDVKQHAFAFCNFQYQKIGNGGFCYGFSMVTYLNYIEKLPLVGEQYSSSLLKHPGYDISEEDRFKENQLYVEKEKDLFNKQNKKDLENVPSSPVLDSITYWYGKQHNIRDHFFDNLGYSDNFAELKSKLTNDEPVPLSLWHSGGGHSVLACGLYQSETNSNVYYVSIYDSNYPGVMQYIKVTEGGSLFGTNALEYGNYTNFQMSNLTVPTEGPFVFHEFEVTGTVVSSTGAVNGAKVTIRNGEYTNFVYTDLTGTFKFVGVPNGEYDIEISAEKYHNKQFDKLLTVCGKNVDVGNIELIPITDGNVSGTSPIVDAVNYEKDVVVHPSLEGVWDPQGIKHQIRIPKVSLNTTSAQMFNQKIYSNHCYGYELLLSNQEANKIFDCTYEYKVYKSVVAVAVLDGFAVQAGGGSLSYKVYYYSLDKDQELTFDEYLDALGITYDTVLSRIMDTNAYKEAMQHAWEPITNMTDCLLDEEGTSAFFENIATMDGWSEIKTSSVISSVPSNEFSWEFDQTTGTVTISGTGSMKDYHCDHDPAPWDRLGYSDLLKHMVIQDGITEIGSFTFAFVDETITIPKSVTKIRAGAFADAWNLQTIYYQGTETEWNDISIDYAGNGVLDSIEIIYLGDNH